MKPITLNSKIYGQVKITQPVLIELIKSKALQRLKDVDNRGPWIFHQSSPGQLSRYSHSVGVMLLLRKYNATLEEQVAGLLHDISHTAFSHVSDFLFKSHYLKHDYQDSKLEQSFEIQGVNKLLKKHKINPKKILNYKSFPLLEKDLPDLCADRIDYTLQDPTIKKLINFEAKKFLDNLIVHKNKWAFKNQTWAKKFGYLYLRLNQTTWCTPFQASIHQIMADALRIALDKKIITKKDLFTTDKIVMRKLKQSKDAEVLEKINLLKNVKIKVVPKNKADFYTRSKPRVADPYFLENNKLVRLSAIDKNYKAKTARWLKVAKKGFYVKIST